LDNGNGETKEALISLSFVNASLPIPTAMVPFAVDSLVTEGLVVLEIKTKELLLLTALQTPIRYWMKYSYQLLVEEVLHKTVTKIKSVATTQHIQSVLDFSNTGNTVENDDTKLNLRFLEIQQMAQMGKATEEGVQDARMYAMLSNTWICCYQKIIDPIWNLKTKQMNKALHRIRTCANFQCHKFQFLKKLVWVHLV